MINLTRDKFKKVNLTEKIGVGVHTPGLILLIFVTLLKLFITHHITIVHINILYESAESKYRKRGKPLERTLFFPPALMG